MKTANSVSSRIQFFGAFIDPLTMQETLSRVEQIILTRKPTQHVVINVAKLVMMQKDQKLREIVNSCELINADGQGVVWGANLLGHRIPERVAGVDLFIQIVKRAAQKGYRLYFLGAKQEIVNKVVQTFKTQYPSLKVAGWRDGYFLTQDETNVASTIAESKADILFVAMSSPQKEYFLNKYASVMNVPFIMGVGGSFDVVAGLTKRAPAWMQRFGLEWFYRFLCEPRRMWKRYFVTNSIYAGMVCRALVVRKNDSEIPDSKS